MKKTRISKNSNSTLKNTKKSTSHSIIVLEGLGKPVPAYFLEKLGDEMVEFVEDEKVLSLNEFFVHKRIYRSFFYNHVKTNEKLKNDYEMAKMILGCRRERGAITRKYDSHSALKMMPFYDEDWANMMRFEADLRKQSQGETAVTINVIEEPIPNSKLVPELKDDNE